MNRKRRFDSWFRGWLPKEPSHTNPFPIQTNQQPSKRRYTAYLTIFVGVLAAVFLTMSAAYGLGLGNNDATFAAATAGVMATIVVSIMLRAPRAPNQNKPLTEKGRRAAKIIAGTNAGMVGVFLGTYFLVNPIIKSVELTLGLWIVLLLSMFLVNNLLYRNFKKQTGMEVM